MLIKKYDFENIKTRIHAAECLQDAGQQEDCDKILLDAAKELLEVSYRD